MHDTKIFATLGEFYTERTGNPRADEYEIGGWFRDDLESNPIVATHLDSWRVAVAPKTGDVFATNPYHKIVRLLGSVRPGMTEGQVRTQFKGAEAVGASLSLSWIVERCDPISDDGDGDWKLPTGQVMTADDLDPDCDACE